MHHIVPSHGVSWHAWKNFKHTVLYILPKVEAVGRGGPEGRRRPTAYCSGCFPLNHLINNQVLSFLSHPQDQPMRLLLVSVVSLYFQVRLFLNRNEKERKAANRIHLCRGFFGK